MSRHKFRLVKNLLSNQTRWCRQLKLGDAFALGIDATLAQADGAKTQHAPLFDWPEPRVDWEVVVNGIVEVVLANDVNAPF